MIYLVYFIAAAIAGLVSGTLGGGIGFVLIPTLVWIFVSQHVPQAIIMHLSIGTAVACVSVMGTVSAISHHRKGAVVWPYVNKSLPLLVIGVIVGSLLAAHLPSRVLMLAFGVVVLFLSGYTLWSKDRKDIKEASLGWSILSVFGFAVGFVGSTLGMNPLCVPFFKRMGLDIHKAVATTVVIGAVLAYAIVVMFIMTGWHVSGLPRWSTGYVDWAVFLPIAIASSFFAPLGAKLSHRLPKKVLKVLYALLLLIVGIKMLWHGIAM